MKQFLTHHSGPDQLLRFKKSIQFIQEVVRSYGSGLYDHIGFSCALAISRAEELRDQVSQFCPAYQSLDELVEVLKQLYKGDSVYSEAERHLEAISAYFNLERYALVRRAIPS